MEEKTETEIRMESPDLFLEASAKVGRIDSAACQRMDTGLNDALQISCLDEFLGGTMEAT